MNRTIISTAQGFRSFDFVSFEHDVLTSLSQLAADLLGSTSTVVTGFAATPDSPADLSINLGAGAIYQLAAADATADGAIPQDLTQILQQGIAAAQKVTLTAPTTLGQSQWNLIQAQFSQVDQVRANDPNSGNPPFYNAANPNSPTYNSVNTERAATVVIQVVKGAAATTGSEVPPNPTSGWVPLYLVDLAFGQTQVTQSQILTAGPSVGTGVPSSYTSAPFIKGLSQLGKLPYLSLTTSQTLTPALQGYLIANGATGLTFTLPAGSSAGNGAKYSFFQQNGSDTLTIATQGSDKIYGPDGWGVSSVALAQQGQFVSLSCDGGNWHVVGQARTGQLLNIQVFTASGTYTPTPGMQSIIAKVQGGGGGGAGATQPTVGNVSLGGPGTAGTYGEGKFTAAQVGASQPVTIGTGGTGGAGAAGNNGGTSSLGTLISCPGGVGGGMLNNVAAPNAQGNGSESSAASGANIVAQLGTAASLSVALSASGAYGGAGGRSAFGDGGRIASLNSAGVNADNYGAGGGGVAINNGGGGSYKGGDAKGGIIIVEEYA